MAWFFGESWARGLDTKGRVFERVGEERVGELGRSCLVLKCAIPKTNNLD